MPLRRLAAATLLALSFGAAGAQSAVAADKPDDRPAIPVEEVPYVRTPQAVVDRMLELAEVGPEDFLVDLGSGDGRIVITAAQQRGARGFGVELDPSLVDASNAAAHRAGVAERARFYVRDLFDTDISAASVLTMYLLPAVNLALRPRLLKQLRPGTRVVSHDWNMGEWQPDASAVVTGLDKAVMPQRSSTLYLWIIPAKVAGAWRVEIEGAAQPMQIEFAQRFQEISGVVTRARGRTLLQSGHVRGAEIRFALIDENQRPSAPLHFFGRVYGDRMEGTIVQGATGSGQRWHAVRAQD